jgi:hypothetical protein
MSWPNEDCVVGFNAILSLFLQVSSIFCSDSVLFFPVFFPNLFQQYFSYILVLGFIWWRKMEYPKKHPTCSHHIMLYRVHLANRGILTHNKGDRP